MAREFSGSLTLVYPRIMIWKNEQWVPLKEGTIFYITTPSRPVMFDSAAVPVQRPRQQTQRWCWQFRMGRNGYLQSVRDGLPRYGRAPCTNWMFPSEPGPGYKFFINNLPELFSNWNLWDAEMTTTNTLVPPDNWESDIKNVRRNQFAYPRNDNDNASPTIATVTDRAHQVIRLKPAFKRAFPIVFVAGAMASRLRGVEADGTSGPKIWDPEHATFMMGLGNMDAEPKRELLGLGSEGQYPKATLLRDNIKNIAAFNHHRRIERGFTTIISDCYKDLLLSLDDDAYVSVVEHGGDGYRGTISPVYAIGYDFRQDIHELADYLYEKLDGIESEINNHESYLDLNAVFSGFILITHSMGGLISRCCMFYHPDVVPKVKGVIHGVQPVVGSPKFYGYFRLGADEYHGILQNHGTTMQRISDAVFQNIIGYTANDFATLASALPGALQLAPSDQYTFDANNNRFNWIQWDEEAQTRLRERNPALAAKARRLPNDKYILDNDLARGYSIYDVYADPTGRVGMLPENFNQRRRTWFNGFNGLAKRFHETIDDYSHQHTYQVNLQGHETANHFDIDETHIFGLTAGLSTRSRNRNDGDGTVPLQSQNFILGGQGRTSNPSRDFTVGVTQSEETHQDVYKRLDVRGQVERWIRESIDRSINEPR